MHETGAARVPTGQDGWGRAGRRGQGEGKRGVEGGEEEEEEEEEESGLRRLCDRIARTRPCLQSVPSVSIRA